MAVNTVDAPTLRSWLEIGKRVRVVDVRPQEQRAEWSIPGSLHIDAYDRLKSGDPEALSGLELDKSAPIVTVCAAGRVSQTAAELLDRAGYEVYSLQNGMKGWSSAWNLATASFDHFQVVQIRRTGKGCLSYIVEAEGKAFVIDASLPIDVYMVVLRDNGWQLVGVADTHTHADHLSRSRLLAQAYDAPLYLPAESHVAYPFTPLHDERMIPIGSVALRPITTPGHTLENVAFLLGNKVLFSGDTLFINSVGRPDLKADEAQTRRKSGLLYDSLQKLLHLDSEILVLPGHTSAPVPFDSTVVGAKLGLIREQLPLLHLSKEEFINTVAARTPPTPPNYLTIVEHNTAGNVNEKKAMDLEAGANRCAI